MFKRNLNRDNTYIHDRIASRCRHPKLIKYYTDAHDVDEDVKTISSYGGLWLYDKGRAGITARNLYSSSLILDGTVASSDI